MADTQISYMQPPPGATESVRQNKKALKKAEEEKKNNNNNDSNCDCDCGGGCDLNGAGECAILLIVFLAIFGVLYGIYYLIACIGGCKPCCCESCACGCYKPIYERHAREKEEAKRKKCKCLVDDVLSHPKPLDTTPVCECVCYTCKPDAVTPSEPNMGTDAAAGQDIVIVIDNGSQPQASPTAAPSSVAPLLTAPNGAAPPNPPAYTPHRGDIAPKPAAPPYHPPPYMPAAPPAPPAVSNDIPLFDYHSASAPQM